MYWEYTRTTDTTTETHTQAYTHTLLFIIQPYHFFHFHIITHFFSRHHANKKGFFTPSRTQKQSFTNHAWRSITQARNNFFHFRAITQQQSNHAITHTYGGDLKHAHTKCSQREHLKHTLTSHTKDMACHATAINKRGQLVTMAISPWSDRSLLVATGRIQTTLNSLPAWNRKTRL